MNFSILNLTLENKKIIIFFMDSVFPFLNFGSGISLLPETAVFIPIHQDRKRKEMPYAAKNLVTQKNYKF